jgi:RNA exonuclease 1
MGSATSGDSELIRITMIDYFTSEILVNNLVEPDVPMQHLNTKYSGVTWADFGRARREGSCLRGKVGARNAIWRFVGTDTVVTGHGTSNDFRSLRWIHPLVVDSSVIEGKFASARRALAAAAAKKAKEEAEMLEAVGGEMMEAVEGEIVTRSKETKKHVEIAPEPHKTKKGEGDCSLKTLTEKRLGRKIQTAGNRGHDSLEDAIAARDVVNWIIMNPDFVR